MIGSDPDRRGGMMDSSFVIPHLGSLFFRVTIFINRFVKPGQNAKVAEWAGDGIFENFFVAARADDIFWFF